MNEQWKLIYILTFWNSGFYRQAQCDSLLTEVSETSGSGTVIHTEENVQGNCSIISTYPWLNDDYITFDDNTTNNNINMVLIKSLDLEVLTEITTYPADLSINYSCDNLNHTIHIRITPENEFDPIFINSPYHSNVDENVKAGTEIINLGDKCRDEDRIRFGVITRFQIHSYQITAFDGRRFIHLDEDTGRLRTIEVLDYDILPRSFFMLNVSVSDDGGRSSLTSVNVSVIDHDDNPPYFTSCSDVTTCHVTTYSAAIDRFFDGILVVTPAAIRAVDGDRGMDADVTYSIESYHVLADNLHIDDKMGHLNVLQPFADFTNFTEFQLYTVPVNITVIEETPQRRSSRAELVLLVYYEFPTTVSMVVESTVQPSPSSHFDYILVLEIAIPVAVLIIVLIILVVILVRKKQKVAKETRYLVGEKEREKSRNVAEHEISTIDVLSSTPINPYELSSVYARISTGSGYEIVEVLSRDDGNHANQTHTRNTTNGNNEADIEPMNEDFGNENYVQDGNSELHPENLYAVVKKPKSRVNNAFPDFVNNTVDDGDVRDNKARPEGEDEVESNTSRQSMECSHGDIARDDETINSELELPPELCGEGEVMY